MTTFIFETNLCTFHLGRLNSLLNEQTDVLKWSVDLEDVDRILKVKSRSTSTAEEIIQLLNKSGFYCEELKD